MTVLRNFYLEIARDLTRFNLGYIWPYLAQIGHHWPNSYMLTSIHANFEARRPMFRDLARARRYRCGR